MKITVIPPVDAEQVRVDAGFDPRGTWYSPRQRRPDAFKALHGNPDPTDTREERS